MPLCHLVSHPFWRYFVAMAEGHFVLLSCLAAAISGGLIAAMVNRYFGWRLGVATALVWIFLPGVWNRAITGERGVCLAAAVVVCAADRRGGGRADHPAERNMRCAGRERGGESRWIAEEEKESKREVDERNLTSGAASPLNGALGDRALPAGQHNEKADIHSSTSTLDFSSSPVHRQPQPPTSTSSLTGEALFNQAREFLKAVHPEFLT